ncbi:hypothetical protein [Deinococcus sp. UYEF24]
MSASLSGLSEDEKTGGTGETAPMVNHMQRFRLGVTLGLLGLILALIEGVIWTLEGGWPSGLQTLLGLAVLGYGVRLLRHKRSR